MCFSAVNWTCYALIWQRLRYMIAPPYVYVFFSYRYSLLQWEHNELCKDRQYIKSLLETNILCKHLTYLNPSLQSIPQCFHHMNKCFNTHLSCIVCFHLIFWSHSSPNRKEIFTQPEGVRSCYQMISHRRLDMSLISDTYPLHYLENTSEVVHVCYL